MRTLKMFVVLALAQAFLMGAAFSQTRGTAEEAKALVAQNAVTVLLVVVGDAFNQASEAVEFGCGGFGH